MLWVNYEGMGEKYGSLRHGFEQLFTTFVSHPWFASLSMRITWLRPTCVAGVDCIGGQVLPGGGNGRTHVHLSRCVRTKAKKEIILIIWPTPTPRRCAELLTPHHCARV